ncbi:hypothetical protein MED134_00285 [Dokdonia sp. MED134]|uniref:DUF3667 domain-containing protein n=1 Tax=Dokdonia sp. MED134 TaxID=313590 RepID=UPI0000689EDF|nr:DUF3667 domain-containing protein [Dokdonia sp. MED134]EAQ39010.1 hypothetical protein MED134_00285 [Dokdonia sp. MED134]
MKETPVKSNSRKAMKYRGVECLNCGHPLDLTDRYCAYCGQINTTKRLTIKDFFNEFVLSVFTYDSRFRYTVKDLLFKPGTITRYYVEGKRLKYANPFRFFLSASISYFILLAIIGFINGNNDLDFTDEGVVQLNVDQAKDDIDSIKEITKDIDLNELQNLNNEEAQLLEEKINNTVEKSVKKLKERKQAQEAKKDSIVKVPYDTRAESSINGIYLENIFTKGEIFYDFYEYTDISDPREALDSLKYSKTRTNVFLYSKNEDIKRVKDNPARFLRFLASKIPFFLFFFAPIFALFLWLIYSKKKFNYMEHLVFIFHIFSWVFLVLLIALIPDLLIGDEIVASLLLILVGPFYFYKALRNFYKQKRRWTILKFVFLNIVFYLGATLFAVIFFAITAFLF